MTPTRLIFLSPGDDRLSWRTSATGSPPVSFASTPVYLLPGGRAGSLLEGSIGSDYDRIIFSASFAAAPPSTPCPSYRRSRSLQSEQGLRRYVAAAASPKWHSLSVAEVATLQT